MDDMTLTPELEAFAAEAIAAGRYRDLAEVVCAGVSLLQRAEGEQDGFYELDEVLAEVDAIIEDEAHARA